MKPQDYIASLIAGIESGSSIPVQVSELELLLILIERDKKPSQDKRTIHGVDYVTELSTHGCTGCMNQRNAVVACGQLPCVIPERDDNLDVIWVVKA